MEQNSFPPNKENNIPLLPRRKSSTCFQVLGVEKGIWKKIVGAKNGFWEKNLRIPNDEIRSRVEAELYILNTVYGKRLELYSRS